MSETAHISQAYTERLAHDYGSGIADVVRVGWRTADLPEQLDEQIAYVRLGESSADSATKPVLFVYGFSGGIVANAPFGAAMAHRRFDIVIPDQNRAGGMPRRDGKINATYGQARNLAAIIEAEGLTETSIDVVTHSYGSLVFDALTQYARAKGWSCFNGAKVALLAPAGVKRHEQPFGFLWRYGALMLGGSKLTKFDDSYWEFGDEMFEAGKGFIVANKLRGLREGWEIMTRRLDMRALMARDLGDVALVPFAEDRLYSSRMLGRSIAAILRNGQLDNVTSFSPVSTVKYDNGSRGGIGADHSDQQFNPERVANAVAGFLRP